MTWEISRKKKKEFFIKVDDSVLKRFSYFKSFHSDDIYYWLSQYLGVMLLPEADSDLRQIVEDTKNNEQALICITFERNTGDMDFLLPYMLADTVASKSLPYHFREGYGKAAIPYLRRAATEAKSKETRDSAQEELNNLK